jgi:hypothetical protein
LFGQGKGGTEINFQEEMDMIKQKDGKGRNKDKGVFF